MRRGLLPAVGRGHAGRGIEPVLRIDGWRHGCCAVGHRDVRRAAHVPELREHVATPFSCIALVILFQPATCSSAYIPGAPHHPRPAIEIEVASERMRLPSEARCVSYSSIRSPGISPGCSDRERVRGAITTRCVRVKGPPCTGVKSLCVGVVTVFTFLLPVSERIRRVRRLESKESRRH